LARHHIAPGERIPLAAYCQIPQVILSTDGSKVGSIDPKLAELGLSRTVAVTVPHFQAIALAVHSSDLLGNAPIGFARFAAGLLDLDLYLTPVDPPIINMCMYWHRRLDRDPCHAWIRAKMADALRFDVRYPPEDLTPVRELP
jgi:DNA-binding transcriptional LysR family regulator